MINIIIVFTSLLFLQKEEFPALGAVPGAQAGDAAWGGGRVDDGEQKG